MGWLHGYPFPRFGSNTIGFQSVTNAGDPHGRRLGASLGGANHQV